MSTKKLQILGSLGNKIYTQPEEPIDAADGSIWLDTDEDGLDIKPGADGITPHIGENGNWFIGEIDTGKPSRGDDGIDGKIPIKGTDYFTDDDKIEIAELAAQFVDIPDDYATEEYVINKIAEASLSGSDVDLSGYAQKSEIPTKVSQLENDSNYLTEHQSLDGYAKISDIPNKPEDIGAQPAGNYALKSEIPTVPVTSVNGNTGDVQLDAEAVGARPNTWMPTAEDVGARPSTWTPTYTDVGAEKSGTASSVINSHNTSSDSHNDLRLLINGLTTHLNSLANSDDTTLDQMAEVVAYIKNNRELLEQVTTNKVNVDDIINNLTTNVSNKPLSAAQGVALKELIDAIEVPTTLSQLTDDSSHRTVTDTEKNAWNAKSNFSGNYADLSGKPTIPTVPTNVSAFTNDAGYLIQHQDISGKLDAAALPTAINTALAQAKESGEFDGKDGSDGVSTTHSWNGTTLTITSASGTSFADLKGAKGDKGDKGDTGAAGYTPIKGTDYWTEEDKAEIVDMVIVSLGGQPVFGRVDSNNNIIITAALADGTYTLKYEYEDGTTADIGTVTVGGENEPTVIAITWNNGQSCSYAIGQSYALTANASYCTSDVIEVEAGANYTLTINNNEKETKFRVVGANDSGIVTEILINNVDIAVGDNTYAFTPSSGTTQIRLRTYVDAHVKATWVLTKE